MRMPLNTGEENHDMAQKSEENSGGGKVTTVSTCGTVLHVSVFVCMFVYVSCCVYVRRKSQAGGQGEEGGINIYFA
jgi:hypothetical protein